MSPSLIVTKGTRAAAIHDPDQESGRDRTALRHGSR
jgi:hypothetical protein